MTARLPYAANASAGHDAGNRAPVSATLGHKQVGDAGAKEILQIIRRRDCVYKVFVGSCAVLCLLLVLAFWFKWHW